MGAWGIVYYKAQDGSVPADDFLSGCDTKGAAGLLAVLEAVRGAPPPSFSGGGKWEAMHGVMGGFFEVRGRSGQMLHRLFCILENGTNAELEKRGFDRPVIVVLCGMSKPNRTVFSDADYARVQKLRDEYCSSMPRRIAV